MTAQTLQEKCRILDFIQAISQDVAKVALPEHVCQTVAEQLYIRLAQVGW